MAKKQKKPSYMTPAAEAVWPWLHKADDREINGKPQTPKFKVSLRYQANAPAWLELKKVLDKLVDESYAKAVAENAKKKKQIVKQFPYKMETDEEGEETGNVLFTLKQTAFIKKKNETEAKPVVINKYDAKLRPLANDTAIYSGSILKASFTTRPFFVDSSNGAGISCDLQSVQVLKLVTAGQRSGESYGFTVEEGFETEEDESDDSDETEESSEAASDETDPTRF